MFKSKRSSQVSPLDPPSPPVASTQYPQQYRQQPRVPVNNGNPNERMATAAMMSPPGHGGLGGPAYSAGAPVDRTMSNTSKSAKGERRKSFFGIGGGGGKKEKEQERGAQKVEQQRQQQSQPQEQRQRPSSFSVHRDPSLLPGSSRPNPSGPNPNFNPNQYPQQMRQFPPPQGGHTPPPPQSVSLGTTARVVSQPAPTASGDFGRDPGQGTMPKSQSMGFNRSGAGGGVPETHPYRGYLNAQKEKEQMQRQDGSGAQYQGQSPGPGQGMSRSPSMPATNGHPIVDRSSPAPPSSQSGGSQRSTSDRGGPTPTGQAGVQGAGAPPTTTSAPQQPAWMREFNTIVELIGMQPQKTYVASPPELEMILARTSAGGQPKQGQPGSASNDWDQVWLQLSGISLSMWSMKETRAAAAKGEKVPPTYFNITDSSLELLAPLPPPPHRPTSHPHHFVFSLNTAGSNRLLFSCPSERDLVKWATGLRLAAWEHARLEEIYTGHLLKSGGREPKLELVRGRMEGWVRVRVMGGTDWKRLWVVLSTPAGEEKEDDKKARRRSFFGLGEKEKETVQEPNTGNSMASFYLEPRTPKNRTVPPVLTITDVTQAYAVFPERLEVMAQSNLMKVVGRISGELVTIEGRMRDSGWALVMPEAPGEGGPSPPPATPLANMMRWVTGFHDVFKLYGRPERYNWDHKDSRSLFYAYPSGTKRHSLFLDMDEELLADFRAVNLPAARRQFVDILHRKMQPPAEEYRDETDNQPTPRLEGDYRLPPLSFGDPSSHHSDHSLPRSLTPITERTDIDPSSRQNSQRTAKSQTFDRQVSGSSQKQGSQGSIRHPSGDTTDRLPVIADSSETFGHHSEEPEQVEELKPTLPPTPTAPAETPTVDSQTGTSVWSQDTGETPTPQRSTVASPLAAPKPQQVSALAAVKGLPDRPPTSATSSVGSPVLGAPVAPPLGAETTLHSPTPRRAASGELSPNSLELREEPAARYLMNMMAEPIPAPSQRVELQDAGSPYAQAPAHPLPSNAGILPGSAASALSSGPQGSPSPERIRPTIVTSFDQPATGTAKQADHLGRKPSGARAPPLKKSSTGPKLEPIPTDAPGSLGNDQPNMPISASHRELGDDAAAYMTYADEPAPIVPDPAPLAPPQPQEDAPRSSFAPSNAAAERRAKADLASQESQRAMNVPGGGKRLAAKDNWSGSEDEDDDEESPIVATARRNHPGPGHTPLHMLQEGQVERSTSRLRALPPVPRSAATDARTSNLSPIPPPESYAQPERSRSRSPQAAASRQLPPQPQQFPQSQSQSYHPPHPSQLYPHAPSPPVQLPQSRTNVWNANFSTEHGMPEQNKSGKFVELDEPAQLTKAFAPHGLLQAGMQDKEERSAKKQEEMAREMGASLVNVPSKPPPPQMGLLGAVAQHEKERQAPGGLGATLTDRERERRMAEDRQREAEKMHRQQMEQMGQYGAQYPYGMPMMGMSMPPMGYVPYQGGYNPYAQQQAMMAAQMAYHHAMMSMSQAGSQHGATSPDRPASPVSIGPNGTGSGFNPYGAGGYGFPQQGAHMSMPPAPFGWPGMGVPQWGSSPAASPGIQGLPSMPSMSSMPGFPLPGMGMGMGQAYGSQEYLHPNPNAQARVDPNSQPGTPFDARSERSRVVSMGSDGTRGTSEDRGREK